MPTLIGAAMIAAAILLSTLINALGSRYVGFESPTEESAWLVDRLTGHVYKCHAPQPAAPPARPSSPPAAWEIGRSGELIPAARWRTGTGDSPRARIRYIAARCPARLNPVP
jgi:hypothetical protein